MRNDIDHALKSWDYRPDEVQARLVNAKDGREILQMRLDLGIMQLETLNRPDGTRPHGFDTYFAYLSSKSAASDNAGRNFRLSEENSREADREFMQFYHRRVCWLALGEYGRAVTDADHTLAFMDFVRDHSPSDEFTRGHEQYRGFVLFHRTQAEAAARAEDDDPEGAIDAVRQGATAIAQFLTGFDIQADLESDPMLAQLRRLEAEIREQHGVSITLQEQLDQAIADEDYEEAARIRDRIRQRTSRTSET